jgi:hypothetical protein
MNSDFALTGKAAQNYLTECLEWIDKLQKLNDERSQTLMECHGVRLCANLEVPKKFAKCKESQND